MVLKGIIDSITGFVSAGTKGTVDIIASAKGNLPPESQVELTKVEAELTKNMANVALQTTASLHDFILKNEQPDRQPVWLLVAKGLIRPFFTYFFLAQLFIISTIDFFNYLTDEAVTEFKLLTAMPDEWWWMLGIILVFYFGERAGSRIVERLSSRNTSL